MLAFKQTVQQWLFYRLIETWLKFIHNYKAFYCAHRNEGPKHISIHDFCIRQYLINLSQIIPFLPIHGIIYRSTVAHNMFDSWQPSLFQRCSPNYTKTSGHLKIVQRLIHAQYQGILWHSSLSRAIWSTKITPEAPKYEFK